MANKWLNGLAGVLLPLSLYGAGAAGAGSYYRAASRSGQTLPVASLPTAALRDSILRDSIQSLEAAFAASAHHDTLASSATLSSFALAEKNHDLDLVHGNSELLVIDASVPDKHLLLNQLRPGIEVVLIESGQDGLKQLQTALQSQKKLDSLHIVSHGADGELQLGNSRLNKTALKQNPELLAALDAAMLPGADLLLYGCDVASTDEGQGLLDLLVSEADVDVAASDDPTGPAALGGDWDLEIVRGDVDASRPFSDAALRDFSGLLALPADNTTFDFSGFTPIFGGYENAYFVAAGIDSGFPPAELRVFGSVAYLYDIGSSGTGPAEAGASIYIGADAVDVGTFQLTNLVASESGPYGFTDLYIVGYLYGGGTVTSGTLTGTGGVTDTFTFTSAGALSTFAGADLTGAALFFTPDAGTAAQNLRVESFTTTAAAAPGGGGGGGGGGGANTAPAVDLDSGVAGVDATATFTEGGTPVAIAPMPSVTDVEGDTITDITVSLTNDQDGVSEGLTVTSAAKDALDGVAFSTDSLLADTISITGASATLAQVATFLGEITYNNTAVPATTTPDRTVTVVINDGTDDSATATSTVTLSAGGGGGGNTAPVLDLNGPGPGIDLATSFTVGGLEIPVVTPFVTTSDADMDLFSEVTVTLTNPLDGASEGLNVPGLVIDTLLGVSGSAGRTGETVISYTGLTVGPLDIDLFLSGIGYSNSAASPSITDRVISFEVRDALGASNSPLAEHTISIVPAADTTPPTITNISIPDSVHKVGEVITATITVDSDAENYALGGSISGTINGYTLGSLSQNSSTEYTATFTITDGGVDRGAGTDVPLSVVLTDAANNPSDAFTAAISQPNDAIYANVPDITLSASPLTITEATTDMSTLTAAISGSLNNQWPDPVTVGLMFAGTATLTSDYTRSGTSINIPANTSTSIATVTAVNDATDDDGESIDVTINSLSVGNNVTGGAVIIGITDDDPAAPPPPGNVAPSSLSLSNTEIAAADTGVNKAVGTLSAADSDSSAFLFSVLDNPLSPIPGSCDVPAGVTLSATAQFRVFASANELQTKTALQAGSYGVCVKVDDLEGGTRKRLFTISVTESQLPPPILSVYATKLLLREGQAENFLMAIFSVKEGQQADITVAVEDPRYANLIQVSPANINLSANGQGQTVTLLLPENDIAEPPDSFPLVVTGKIGDAVFYREEVELTLQSNDVQGIVVSPSTLEIEEGESGQFLVSLTAEPVGNILLALEPSAGENSSVADRARLSAQRLAFDDNNWNEPIIVGIEVINDSIPSGQATVDIKITAASDSDAVTELTANVLVDIVDDDTVKIGKLTTAFDTLGAGMTGGVNLSQVFNEDVMGVSKVRINLADSLRLSSTQPLYVNNDPDNTFSAVVSPGNIMEFDFADPFTITSGTTIPITIENVTNPDAAGVIQGTTIQLLNTDGVIIAESFASGVTIIEPLPQVTSVSYENKAYKLGDTVSVTINVNPSDDDFTSGQGGLSGTVAGYPLQGFTFESSTIYKATFLVDETGGDIAAGDSVPFSLAITNSAGKQGEASIGIIEDDNDAFYVTPPTIGIEFSDEDLELAEGVGDIPFNFIIEGSLGNTWPEELVVFSRLGEGYITGSDISLPGYGPVVIPAFESKSNATRASIVDDAIDEGATESGTIIIELIDSDRDVVSTAEQQIAIADNDTAGIALFQNDEPVALEEISLTLTEGQDGTSFGIALSSEPGSDVNFQFTPDSNRLTVTPASFTLTPDNWDSPQMLRISAVDNEQNEDTVTANLSALITSDDPFYDLDFPSAPVQIIDNDPGMIQIRNFELTSSIPGSEARYDFDFKVESQLFADGAFFLEFPAGFVLNSLAPEGQPLNDYQVFGGDLLVTWFQLSEGRQGYRLKYQPGIDLSNVIDANGYISLADLFEGNFLQNATLPSAVGMTGQFTFRTVDSEGDVVDVGSAPGVEIFQPLELRIFTFTGLESTDVVPGSHLNSVMYIGTETEITGGKIILELPDYLVPQVTASGFQVEVFPWTRGASVSQKFWDGSVSEESDKTLIISLPQGQLLKAEEVYQVFLPSLRVSEPPFESDQIFRITIVDNDGIAQEKRDLSAPAPTTQILSPENSGEFSFRSVDGADLVQSPFRGGSDILIDLFELSTGSRLKDIDATIEFTFPEGVQLKLAPEARLNVCGGVDESPCGNGLTAGNKADELVLSSRNNVLTVETLGLSVPSIFDRESNLLRFKSSQAGDLRLGLPEGPIDFEVDVRITNQNETVIGTTTLDLGRIEFPVITGSATASLSNVATGANSNLTLTLQFDQAVSGVSKARIKLPSGFGIPDSPRIFIQDNTGTPIPAEVLDNNTLEISLSGATANVGANIPVPVIIEGLINPATEGSTAGASLELLNSNDLVMGEVVSNGLSILSNPLRDIELIFNSDGTQTNSDGSITILSFGNNEILTFRGLLQDGSDIDVGRQAEPPFYRASLVSVENSNGACPVGGDSGNKFFNENSIEEGLFELAVEEDDLPEGEFSLCVRVDQEFTVNGDTIVDSIIKSIDFTLAPPDPIISNVSIPQGPNGAHVPGDTVIATLSIEPASVDFSDLTLSGTIAGFEVSNFQRTGPGTYTAEFTIPTPDADDQEE